MATSLTPLQLIDLEKAVWRIYLAKTKPLRGSVYRGTEPEWWLRLNRILQSIHQERLEHEAPGSTQR